MPKVSLASVENAPAVALPEGALGSVEVRAIFNRDFDPIHLYQYRLGPGCDGAILRHADRSSDLRLGGCSRGRWRKARSAFECDRRIWHVNDRNRGQ